MKYYCRNCSKSSSTRFSDGLCWSCRYKEEKKERAESDHRKKMEELAEKKSIAEIQRNLIERKRIENEARHMSAIEEIERERLDEEKSEREQRKQEIQVIKKTRQILADCFEKIELIKKSTVDHSNLKNNEYVIRQSAYLHACNIYLNNNSDVLLDLYDLKELSSFRLQLSKIFESLESHKILPKSFLQDIEDRLYSLNYFFDEVKISIEYLLNWKKKWLDIFPVIGINDLSLAHDELLNLKSNLHKNQQDLYKLTNDADWDITGNNAVIYSELRFIAEKLLDIKYPESEQCKDFLEFSKSTGILHEKITMYLNDIENRIISLKNQHEKHEAICKEAENHLENHNFRSAEKLLDFNQTELFNDIDYKKANEALASQLLICKKYNYLLSNLNFKNIKNTEKTLQESKELKIKIGSELEFETTAAIKEIEVNIQKLLHKRKIKIIFLFSIIGLFIIANADLFEIVLIENYQKYKNDKYNINKLNIFNDLELKPGTERDWEIAPRVKMTFCWCPAGNFTMGSPESEEGRSSDENQVKVTLTKGFWMAKTEVTQTQWSAVMGNNPSNFKGDNLPVEQVSWNDAQDFLAKLNAKLGHTDGGKMFLPTEAQWEYAARSGQTSIYAGSDQIDEVAWYYANSDSNTHPVGTKKGNPWGLYDMSGNVHEWCADWYDGNLPVGLDPAGQSSGEHRVFRGGSFDNGVITCRAADRGNGYPTYKSTGIGFRISRSSATVSNGGSSDALTMKDVVENPQPQPQSQPKSNAQKVDISPSESYSLNEKRSPLMRNGGNDNNDVTTPMNRYKSAVSSAVEAEWHKNCTKYRDFISAGRIIVKFHIEPDGKINNIITMEMVDAGEVQKGFTLSAIRQAKIPPIPSEIRNEIGNKPLELIYNFNF